MGVLLLSMDVQGVLAQRMTPQQLVQQQIDGWNTHDAVKFTASYADTTTLYTFPDQVLARFRSHKEIEDYYTKVFKDNPNLHCDVANQMVTGNTVIVHEKISGWTNRPNFDTLVIYHIENDKIVSVHFVRK
ncbi:nuclear transport factor 2 family protein [Spirosoma validum]|uniref:Nuclear transport factor 2 family protein n=1 Tax=Spirosoma validum TaxID=2771355 RepID=A0A927B0R4_9BACT|nr:nuclear transport factor 2 family protein [Spirosoma validum]MBD2753256.1 nuclear transport factor 2 family protein [Spirosoma validum]